MSKPNQTKPTQCTERSTRAQALYSTCLFFVLPCRPLFCAVLSGDFVFVCVAAKKCVIFAFALFCWFGGFRGFATTAFPLLWFVVVYSVGRLMCPQESSWIILLLNYRYRRRLCTCLYPWAAIRAFRCFSLEINDVRTAVAQYCFAPVYSTAQNGASTPPPPDWVSWTCFSTTRTPT